MYEWETIYIYIYINEKSLHSIRIEWLSCSCQLGRWRSPAKVRREIGTYFLYDKAMDVNGSSVAIEAFQGVPFPGSLWILEIFDALYPSLLIFALPFSSTRGSPNSTRGREIRAFSFNVTCSAVSMRPVDIFNRTTRIIIHKFIYLVIISIWWSLLSLKFSVTLKFVLFSLVKYLGVNNYYKYSNILIFIWICIEG